MTQNHDLLTYLDVARFIAAVSTTTVPVLYSFYSWRSRMLGRLFMMQAVAFALGIDTTLVLTTWGPGNFLIHFWVKMVSLTAISISTIALSIKMWQLNHKQRKKDEGKHDSQQQGLRRG